MPLDPVGIAASYTAPVAKDATAGAVAPADSGGEGFAAAITRAIQEANADQVDATSKAVDLVVRGEGTIHDAMIAADNAEGSFRLLMEMRNRLIEGVNRLLETQV